MTLVQLRGGTLDGAGLHLVSPTLPLVLRFAPVDGVPSGIMEVGGRQWVVVGADFDDHWPEQVSYAHSTRYSAEAGGVVYEHLAD